MASSSIIEDKEYDEFLSRIAARFLQNVEGNEVFTTDAKGLWHAFLNALPEDERQSHRCGRCVEFVERFGGLVTISDKGDARSAIWNMADAGNLYKPSFTAMLKILAGAKVTGVFRSSKRVWGSPTTGSWHHFHVVPPLSLVYFPRVSTARQAMAAKREDFKNVSVAIDDFTPDVLKQAVRLLKSEALYRSEAVLGQAVWLQKLQNARKGKLSPRRENIVWRAIATAPPGFCHPRSSMIGTLLENIAAGMDFAEVSKRFEDKMHPLQYQRPQAAPAAGAIAQAEKIVDQLGAAGSLARRYCRIDEVVAVWRPKRASKEGVFSHLNPKARATDAMEIPPITMTWDKFQRSILPSADRIEYFVLPRDQYSTLLTAVNPEAPPILQWDLENERNPVSQYLWHGGSPAEQYGLQPDVFHDVAAVTLLPCMWGSKEYPHHGVGVIFCLTGARETVRAGLCLFPQTLKAEFHGIRSVIEEFSKKGKLEGTDSDHASGPMLTKGSAWNARIRVTSNGQSSEYILDRWD